MAKRVRMIAPFDVLTGNVSGKQNLKYANHNNPAWDAPNGVQYARNYRPSYIVSENQKTGTVHFALKKRSAVKLSVQSRHAMALLAAARGIYDALSVNLTLVASLQACYNASAAKAEGKSIRTYVFEKVYPQMKRGSKQLGMYERANGQSISCTFENPFFDPLQSGTLEVIAADYSNETLVKFWDQLAVQAGKFEVEGLEGIFFIGWTWEDLISDEFGYNILGVTEQTVGSNTYAKIGDMWMQVKDKEEGPDDWIYVKIIGTITGVLGDNEYRLVAEAPTA